MSFNSTTGFNPLPSLGNQNYVPISSSVPGMFPASASSSYSVPQVPMTLPSLSGNLMSPIQSPMNTASNFGSGLVNRVDNFGTGVVVGADKLGYGLATGAVDASKASLNTTYDVGQGVLSGASMAGRGVVGGAAVATQGLFSGVKDLASGLKNVATDTIGGTLSGTKEFISDSYSAITGKPTSGMSAMQHPNGTYSASNGNVAITSPLEAQLIDAGFIPQSNVMVNDKGRKYVEFIKVKGPDGTHALVEMDMPGQLLESSETYVTSSGDSVAVPYNVQMSMEDCLNNGSCGAAFVCNGDFCVLRRDPEDMQIKKQFLQIVKEKHNNNGMIKESDSPIFLPIVMMSEIVDDPASVRSKVRKSYYESIDKAMLLARAHREEFENELNGINVEYANLCKCIKDTKNTLQHDVAGLLNLERSSGIPANDEQLAKFNKMRANIALRHDYMLDLLSTCKLIQECSQHLRVVRERLISANQTISDVNALKYKDLTDLTTLPSINF